MIENCFGVLGLPLGLGTGFKINNQFYVIPMAVEEPSVITACSVIGKLIGRNGGFTGECMNSVMISQIQILDIKEVKNAVFKVKKNQKEICEFANRYCESMTKRGGGV